MVAEPRANSILEGHLRSWLWEVRDRGEAGLNIPRILIPQLWRRSQSAESPGWTRDPDCPGALRTSSDVQIAQINGSLAVADGITGRLVNPSDARLKEKIVAHTPEDDDASRAAIVSLPTYEFDWKPGTDSAGQHVPCGVLAQDVAQHIGHDAVGPIGKAEVDGETVVDLVGVRQDVMMPRLIEAAKSIDRGTHLLAVHAFAACFLPFSRWCPLPSAVGAPSHPQIPSC